MLSKACLYLHNVFIAAGVNRIRTALTSAGIFIAVTIYAAGMILTESYYNEQLAVISDIDPGAVVVKCNEEGPAADEVGPVVPVPSTRDMVALDPHSVFSEKLSDGHYLTIMSHLHGLDSQRYFSPVITDKGMFLAQKSVIIKGRLIFQSDVQNKAYIAVLDEATAGIIFPGEDPVGKYITIDEGVNGSSNQSEGSQKNKTVRLKIVGVIQSAYYSQSSATIVKNQIRQRRGNVSLETNIYIPISVLIDLFGEEISDHYCFKTDHSSFDETVSRMNAFVEVKSKAGANYSVITKDDTTRKSKSGLSNIRVMINMTTAVLCLMSGISIMSVVFFSVKERISEIGIRKAFGATGMDIVFQFVSEIVVIAVIASIVSTCVTYIACRLAVYELFTRSYIYFPIRISSVRLILPVCIGVTEAFICSLIPGVYASRIRTVEALRFE